MKKLLAVLLILAAALCVSAACTAEKKRDPSMGTYYTMKVTPDKVLAGDTVMVDIVLENNTGEDFLSPVTLCDPDGNCVEDFDGEIVKAGGKLSWSGFWTVTEEQLKARKICYTAVYRYRDRDGEEQEARRIVQKMILPDSKRTPEPTPVPTPEPTPRPEDRPKVILYSVLKEKTEDGSTGISLCCIDADGELWSLEAADAEGNGEILQLLRERRGMKSEGKITGSKYGGKYVDRERIRELAVMADCVPAAAETPEKTGAGIGENAVYALKYDPDGNPEAVLLGMSGDAVFENRDPGAQALYRFMTCFQCFNPPCGFAEEGLTPYGFRMVTAREFFGLENVNAETAAITAAMTDCEEGFIKVQLTEEDRRKALALLERGVVIGKENPWEVTGGTMVYFFRDEGGELLGTIETYEEDGLAVGPDGMYRMALLPESTDGLPEAEKQLLRLKINGVDYELGRSTPRDLIRNGWYCYIENDGSFAFTDDEGYGTFYVRTYGGGVDEPIKTIDCQFAYTISFEYCGFDG